MRNLRLLAVVGILWLSSGGPALGASFENVSAAAGIVAPHATPSMNITYFSIGQAWGDYDRDGWVDLYVTDNGGPNHLFRNQGDGTFATSSLASQVQVGDRPCGGAVFGDYDNDGWLDLYVLSRWGNLLFHNDGGAGFTNVTAAAGVGDTGKGETAAWGDYDRDGWLDLYVANWLHDDCSRVGACAGNSDRLYHNLGNGSFEDVTALLDDYKTRAAGFVGSWVDYDDDGDLDIYVVNDMFAHAVGNVLWRNDGPGCAGWCFTDVSQPSGTDVFAFGMGLAIGDYDRDGWLDFYFTNLGPNELHRLLRNGGNGTFSDVSAQAGVALDTTGWGTTFFDYDNDGWLDLFVTNSLSSPNHLYRNQGNGSFASATAGSGLGDWNQSHAMGVATADFDRDGWMDLVVGNGSHPGYQLYRNLGAGSIIGSRNWLTVRLEGTAGINRDAIGSRVVLFPTSGPPQIRDLRSGSSLGAGEEMLLHFGLGDAEVDSLIVIWPDIYRTTTTVQNPEVDHELVLRYPWIFGDGFEDGTTVAW